MIREETSRMARQAADWLTRREMYARTVTSRCATPTSPPPTRSHSTAPTREMSAIVARAVELLARTDAGQRPIRLLGVSVHNLTSTDAPQRDWPATGSPFETDQTPCSKCARRHPETTAALSIHGQGDLVTSSLSVEELTDRCTSLASARESVSSNLEPGDRFRSSTRRRRREGDARHPDLTSPAHKRARQTCRGVLAPASRLPGVISEGSLPQDAQGLMTLTSAAHTRVRRFAGSRSLLDGVDRGHPVDDATGRQCRSPSRALDVPTQIKNEVCALVRFSPRAIDTMPFTCFVSLNSGCRSCTSACCFGLSGTVRVERAGLNDKARRDAVKRHVVEDAGLGHAGTGERSRAPCLRRTRW